MAVTNNSNHATRMVDTQKKGHDNAQSIKDVNHVRGAVSTDHTHVTHIQPSRDDADATSFPREEMLDASENEEEFSEKDSTSSHDNQGSQTSQSSQDATQVVRYDDDMMEDTTPDADTDENSNESENIANIEPNNDRNSDSSYFVNTHDVDSERREEIDSEILRQRYTELLSILKERKNQLKDIELKRRTAEREVQKLNENINNIMHLKNKSPVPCFKIRHPKGVVGLQNLGNSCYLNSALQCLVKSPGIRDYFLTDEYKKDINTFNRLGTGGELADAFGDFLKDIYKGEYADLSPRFMKYIIGKYCSQFSDYSQQDSAELIQYVLDGLHEDLNRILDKPQTGAVEGKGRSDHQVSEEAWRVHKLRNDSIFVDKFQGQYRSRLFCSNCKDSTSTFDPFFNLTVPVPIPSRFRKIEFLYIPSSKSEDILLYCAVVNVAAGIRGLREAISKLLNINLNSFFIAELYHNGSIRSLLNDIQSESDIFSNDKIVVYQVPEILNVPEIHQLHSLYSRKNLMKHLPFACIEVSLSERHCYSFIISLDNASNRDVYDRCKAHLSRYELDGEEVLQDAFMLFIPTNIEGRPPHFIDNNDDEFQIINSHKGFPVLLLEFEVETMRFWNIPVIDLAYDTFPKSSSYNVEIPQEKPKTLYECLDMFSKQESLTEGGTWICPACKKKGDRMKKTDIWRLPEMLIIQLNRFQSQDYTRTKLTHPIDFPIYNLDMSKYTENPDNVHLYYDLYAVSNHYGTLSSGHYTSFGKITDPSTGVEKWHKYDDMTVTEIDPYNLENEIVTPAGYVLFYQAKPKLTPPPYFSSPTIQIEIASQKRIRMIYSPSTTTKELKNFILSEGGLNPEEYTLYNNHSEIDLSKNMTFEELDIKPSMTLMLLPRMK